MEHEEPENPFNSESVANEWIASVEGEDGLWRDKVLYKELQRWLDALDHRDVLLDVGSGQGRLSSEITGYGRYVGIEPSDFLVARAKQLYSAANRTFVRADAYHLTLPDESVDAATCINVLFHLKDAGRAIQEIARVIKPGGSFFLLTADNDSLELWRSFFVNPVIDREKIEGEMRLPVNNLSRNTLYFQPNDSIVEMLRDSGLTVTSTEKSYPVGGQTAFLIIRGVKIV